MKKFGAMQIESGEWQMFYLNSAHGPGGEMGPKCICQRHDGDTIIMHSHPTISEAENCAMALGNIGSTFMPEKFETPVPYGTDTSTKLDDDVAVEAEIADDNALRGSEESDG